MSATNARLRVIVLGCGASGGAPRADGDWGACDPSNPKNRRSRSSILVQRKPADAPWSDETCTSVLVDTAPELRQQLVAAGVGRIDAALYTHAHADQTHGIDDLRPLALKAGARLAVHADRVTADVLSRRFDYAITPTEGSLYPPILDLHADLAPGRSTTIDGPGGPIEALALRQSHGPIESLGFRFGPVAYSNDVVEMPRASFEALAGVDTWIVDALQYEPHRTHAHLAKTLSWIERVKPRRGILTNLHIVLDYDRVNAQTPVHITPAHDGMIVELELANEA